MKRIKNTETKTTYSDSCQLGIQNILIPNHVCASVQLLLGFAQPVNTSLTTQHKVLMVFYVLL